MINLIISVSDAESNMNTTGAVFQNPTFNFQFLRTIGTAHSGGADINECLDTAYRINNNDTESWYTEWNKTAGRLEETGDELLAQKNAISAREAYLRASNYYRTAGIFLTKNQNDPRIVSTWKSSRDCFLKAASLSNNLIRPVRIPFENTTLPGYFCLVDNTGKKRPLLIVQDGTSGTGEGLYFRVANAAVERGYNVLIFEGPGQGEVIRVQKIPFRYNWESVVTPVVNYALKQNEVDSKRIALMGISFGGYLAPRAVAFEPRIDACIANGGVYDFNDSVLKRAPPNIEDILSDENKSKIFDQGVLIAMNQSVEIGYTVGNGMYAFGAKTPSDFLRTLSPYNLKEVAPLIKCNMLVIDSENDTVIPGQAKPLYDALTCPKTFMLFTSEEGAGHHTQVGAEMISNERIFNWLDAVTAVQSPTLLIINIASPTNYSIVGQNITYTYYVINSGNVNITGPINVTDNKIGTFTISASGLTPGQTVTGTANYTITRADLERCPECDHSHDWEYSDNKNHIVGCNGCNDNATPNDLDHSHNWDHSDHNNDNATPCPCSVTNEAFATGIFENSTVTSNIDDAIVTVKCPHH